jgi:hypothetical protein
VSHAHHPQRVPEDRQRRGGVLCASSAIARRGRASRHVCFALIADSHIIDDYYKGPESNPEDTESMFKTAERLTAARDFINLLQRNTERVFLIGDYFHNYPSPDIDFYSYGPPHLVMAATRYDEDAYLIVNVDTSTGTHELLNIGLVDWNTHYSEPYQPRA